MKLSSVVADIMGVSSRAMLTALVAGERDPVILASLARGTLVRKRAQLADALTGHFTDHHAFLLDQLLQQIDALGCLITTCDARITEANAEHETTLQRLQTVPGIGRRSAEVIISEIGVDMSRLASSAHLASWARLCPGTHESAESAEAPAPAPATIGCGRRCSNRRGPRPISARIWVPSIDGLRSVEDRSGPPSPSRTAFWSSRCISCATGANTKSWEPTTSTACTFPGNAAIICGALSTWDAT